MKLIHASDGGSGREWSLSAHIIPFWHISFICFVPLDEGPNQMPSISIASLGGMVGIGADDPSSNGTLICDGLGGASVVGIIAVGAGKLHVVPIDGCPPLYL